MRHGGRGLMVNMLDSGMSGPGLSIHMASGFVFWPEIHVHEIHVHEQCTCTLVDRHKLN